MSLVHVDASDRGFSTYMTRSMEQDDLLTGVMGLDKPPPHTRRGRGCTDHYVRDVRLKVAAHAPLLLTLNRKVQYIFDALSREGISLSILRRGIRRQAPCPGDVAGSLGAASSAQQRRQILQACSDRWGVQAARHIFAHINAYAPLSIVHILTCRDAMYLLIGRPRTASDAQARIRQALKLVHPNSGAKAARCHLAPLAQRGRERLCDGLLKLDEIISQPIYRKVLFHPEVATWGDFSALGGALLAAAVLLSAAWLWTNGVVGCTLIVGFALALASNEARLWFKGAWCEDSKPSGGIKAWAIASRYTGRIWLVEDARD